ncbi:UDP-N-acetylmuramoyl-L-alanine--D-glutamate ligase [Saliterribacillus persicus]|uniref:UDP-N-acetylmuramoylalanine--D-glutamate ligase n=1 Tax=Saliterribacillus persicus TaxID=930114 RepID=A0A368XS62_9BACI|nr:UDP-N-acetylmuramoyl-L-alanine--D-glutamate ligase [Saliterribacillus persicus]RCW70802.1 UDP-N-acetylmuramoylalanine--D-glutamate ligase [Saliterribacillus persicus]
MNNKLINFPYKRILVLGLAKSGTATAKLLNRNNCEVIVNDLNAKADDPFVLDLKAQNIEVVVGSHPLSLLDNIDVVIKNPGIPYENQLIESAIEHSIPVLTEIELVNYLTKNPIIGITGSNGKTTTTTLIYKMIEADNQKVSLAGNIGMVASEVAEKVEKDEAMVIELSSFQLLGIEDFRPKIAILLNLFEAHLDYHKTIEHYRKAKMNIFKNQTIDDFLVYNADNTLVNQSVEEASSIKVPFSKEKKLDDGVWVDQEYLYFKSDEIIKRKEIKLVGEHNLENIMAAVAAAKLYNISNNAIRSILKTFTGVEHRLQFIDNIAGKSFYNDSKATNILATSKALDAFDKPIILLAGGLDRGNEFDALVPHLTNVKAMVLFGETAPKLATIAKRAGIDKVEIVEAMEEAVAAANASSTTGDVILLSPACASWDQYRTFEERGDMFVQEVHKLK